ncbi:MAG: hypothetical protein J6V66_04180 [Clostridia bacterium]|nr:hypothetical protein [Clostridia bacterium]
MDDITMQKVNELKNSKFRAQLEREINDMFFRIISSVLAENNNLKRQNASLKKVVKKTMNEKDFLNFTKISPF